MINTEPKVDNNARFELREAAEILGVSTSSITKWTAAGLMRAGRKRLNGRRCWTGAELIRAWRAFK